MSRQESGFEQLIKLLLIGDSGVGKTCLLLRYASDLFSQTFITTIGIDYKIKHTNIDGKHVKIQIWDTAGQERFRTITTSYFKGAEGILLVYDVTDLKSFQSIKGWMRQIEQHADLQVNKILIGNKCDSDEDRVVSYEDGAQLASEYGIKFFETSAKSNVNIDVSFLAIAKEVNSRLHADDRIASRTSESFSVKKEKTSEDGGCC